MLEEVALVMMFFFPTSNTFSYLDCFERKVINLVRDILSRNRVLKSELKKGNSLGISFITSIHSFMTSVKLRKMHGEVQSTSLLGNYRVSIEKKYSREYRVFRELRDGCVTSL